MRVLIVDDEATSRILIKAMVTKLGHECLVAEDGEEAWRILSTQDIDVLLSDWLMPGVNGPELCRRTRREQFGRYVYIVLITSLDFREQVLEGMGAGADDYLVKPVDPFILETRLVAAARVTSLHRRVAHFQAELERANQELLGQSLTDPLTGLGNRRSMEEALDQVAHLASRTGRPFAVAMFDIDHFKQYNDFYGHQAGDEILSRVSDTIRTSTRTGESTYRYGGEEFLLLVPEGVIADAHAAAERVRRAVEALAIPHLSRPTFPAVVTLSAGVASCYGSGGCRPADTLSAADQALFAAKTAGRNRVVDASPALVIGHPSEIAAPAG